MRASQIRSFVEHAHLKDAAYCCQRVYQKERRCTRFAVNQPSSELLLVFLRFPCFLPQSPPTLLYSAFFESPKPSPIVVFASQPASSHQSQTMLRRRLMVAGGCHLRLAREAPLPPVGSPRCTAGRRPVGSSGQPLLPLQEDREPYGVRDAGHVDGGGSSPTPASRSCLGSERWTSCYPHAGPADDAWLSQDQARHSLHGLPEPDGAVRGAAWVEIDSSSPPTAACCPASAPQLWHPSQGGVPRGGGACLHPQVRRAKHTIDGLLELDDVRDAACVDGGGSSSPTAASCLASKPQLWRPPSHAGVRRGTGACLLPQARAVHTLLDALPELNDVRDATCVDGVCSSAPPVASCLAFTPQLWRPSGTRLPPGKDAWLLPQARVQPTLHVLAEPDGRRRPTSISGFQLAPNQLCSHSLADKPHARAAPTMFGTPPCSHTLIRSYSTSSVAPTTFLSLERPNPPIKVKPFRVTFGNPELLLEQVKSDHRSYVRELRDDDLKSEYFTSVRPFLLSCCLVCSPDHLNEQDAGLLYSNNEHFISKDPNYLTSLDLMRKLKVYHKDNWGHLLNFIRDNRVMIVECWTTTLGSIEAFVYDHGLSGPPGDAQYYRGQSDASIKSNKGNGLNNNEKYASLCTLIWKGYQVKDCQVFRRVRCSSKITRAEMLAMFALVRRGVEGTSVSFQSSQTVKKLIATTGELAPLRKIPTTVMSAWRQGT